MSAIEVGDRVTYRQGPSPRPVGEVLAVDRADDGIIRVVIDWGMVQPDDVDLRPRVSVAATDEIEHAPGGAR